MSAEFCEVIITADNADWLVAFTRRLVEDRLAACGQNITAIRSIYRWEGAVQDDAEARVALHTRCVLVPAIIERTNTEHPYDVPVSSPCPSCRGTCVPEVGRARNPRAKSIIDEAVTLRRKLRRASQCVSDSICFSACSSVRSVARSCCSWLAFQEHLMMLRRGGDGLVGWTMKPYG